MLGGIVAQATGLAEEFVLVGKGRLHILPLGSFMVAERRSVTRPTLLGGRTE